MVIKVAILFYNFLKEKSTSKIIYTDAFKVGELDYFFGFKIASILSEASCKW